MTFFFFLQKFETDPYQQRASAELQPGNPQKKSGNNRECDPQDDSSGATKQYGRSTLPRRQPVRGHPDHDGVVAAQDQVDDDDPKYGIGEMHKAPIISRDASAIEFAFGGGMRRTRLVILLAAVISLAPFVFAQQRQGALIPAPNRSGGEGAGPYRTLVIRGATLIDGTGAPPRGPVDIVVENNRIRAIQLAGTPGVPMRPNRAPQNAQLEIDAAGMYVLPGFVDMHAHAGGAPKNADAEYAFKLWLAHGVTTIRGVPLGSNEFTTKEKDRSARNQIVGPRIVNYQRPGTEWNEGPVTAPDTARAWVRWAANNGIDGLKLDSYPPGSAEWNAYLKEHLALGTVFDPTFTSYVAARDVMRMRNADWNDKYVLPSLMQYYEPDRENHGSFYFNWTTADEIAWRNFYQVWFRLVNDYKRMGGRITTGSDSGFIYNTYGFGYVQELELLQEAGLHPLEVIQAATMNGALTLAAPKNKPIEFGIVREGLLADMVIVDQNPLENLKVLYGTGAVRLKDQTGRVERVGGVKWTIKDGIVYDAKKLLAEVARMVEKQKQEMSRRPAQVTP